VRMLQAVCVVRPLQSKPQRQCVLVCCVRCDNSVAFVVLALMRQCSRWCRPSSVRAHADRPAGGPRQRRLRAAHAPISVHVNKARLNAHQFCPTSALPSRPERAPAPAPVCLAALQKSDNSCSGSGIVGREVPYWRCTESSQRGASGPGRTRQAQWLAWHETFAQAGSLASLQEQKTG
jgi:hypothetical protein